MTDKEKPIEEMTQEEARAAGRWLEWWGAVQKELAIATPSLNKLLSLLDTMQEEPVSVWNDASKKYPFAGKEIIVLRDNKIYYGKYIGGFHRYVRAEIQLTYDTVQTYAIIDYLTEKDKWIYVEDLLKLSNVERTVKDRKEPVSEELEKVSDQYSQSIHSDYSNDMFDRGDIYEAVIYGAEWQKEQMKEALRTEYEKGKHDALEEMKKEEEV